MPDMKAPTNSANTYCAIGSEDLVLQDEDVKKYLNTFLDSVGPREDVLILPPDYTRYHSQAGRITQFISEYFNFTEPCDNPEGSPAKSEGATSVSSPSNSPSHPSITLMPALGTHMPMTKDQIKSMFGEQIYSKDCVRIHDWRNDVVTIGYAPAEMVRKATNGMVDQEWPAQLNKLVWGKRKHDTTKQAHKTLVLSIGQVVPHEVMGMANFNKNLFVGVGGVEAINLSHFIGAVHGMEKMMGRASNPLRSILNYASENFLQDQLDLWYILTVMGTNKITGKVEMKGLYIGNDIDCYSMACDLSLKVNFTLLDRAPKKVVVFLDKSEFHSTWLGNKAIYRTRMAIADGGDLLILAPGVKQFGEDDEIDRLIRQHGYRGTPHTMNQMKENGELKKNLSAVAHLIHGSSEGRFQITYCPGHLSREEIESVGFQYQDLNTMMNIYDVSELRDGWNSMQVDGKTEEFYFISNPALGLWALTDRFDQNDEDGSADKEKSVCETDAPWAQKANPSSGGVGGWARPPSE
mmetsp:Transcript_4308/g.12019  ORF Transcript_4308/g.12019 Transcript_4308/m.12019 type:complete len:521 (-) Transcript_4308:1753-3315(-)